MEQQKLQVDIKSIDAQDLQEVLRLENEHEFPWTQAELVGILNNGGYNNSFVARDKKEFMVGYVIAQPEPKQLRLLNLMVEPEVRLQGVGRTLIRHLITRARKRRKAAIVAEVREKNTSAQIFYRKCGFVWIKTLHGYYEDLEEDCYLLKRTVI